MSSLTIRDEILERLEHLPEAAQRQVLNLVRRLPATTPTAEGTPIEDLFALSGTLDGESAHQIEEAIEAGCEQVDLDAW